MRIPRLLAAAVLLLVLAGAAAVAAASKESPRMEVLTLAQQRSKVAYLELSILLKTQELKSKDRDIQWQRTRMSQDIATLQSEIESLQSKGSVAGGKQTDKANAWVIELENQIVKLKNHMEKRASDAKKQVQELNATLERLEKTRAEQERRVQKTEHALEVAEEELMRVQLEAKAKCEQLGEVHGAWLPPWLATHAARSMELMSSQWIEHGKPAFNGLLQKASEKSVQATEWAKPHMETAKEKWIPVIKENWVAAKTNTEPYVQIVSAKSVEVYEASRDAISPHVLKAHEFADPYFQEAKKLSKSYIDQVAKASKPHVEKLKTTLNPYTEEAGQAYENFRSWCSDLDGNLERVFLKFYLELHGVTPMVANFLHEFYMISKGSREYPFWLNKLKDVFDKQ